MEDKLMFVLTKSQVKILKELKELPSEYIVSDEIPSYDKYQAEKAPIHLFNGN